MELTVGSGHRLSVPKVIRDLKNIEHGDWLHVTISDSKKDIYMYARMSEIVVYIDKKTVEEHNISVGDTFEVKYSKLPSVVRHESTDTSE